MAILLLTVYLFAFEVVRVDVAAVSIMVLLGLTSLIPGYDGLVSPEQLFSGYSSNAVISIIAVMIIGAGLDRTGLMGQLAGKILKHGGQTEGRVIMIISTVVGLVSSFLQNIGAARTVFTRGEQDCETGQPGDFQVVDAHGVLRHFGRNDHHGGVEPSDSAE